MAAGDSSERVSNHPRRPFKAGFRPRRAPTWQRRVRARAAVAFAHQGTPLPGRATRSRAAQPSPAYRHRGDQPCDRPSPADDLPPEAPCVREALFFTPTPTPTQTLAACLLAFPILGEAQPVCAFFDHRPTRAGDIRAARSIPDMPSLGASVMTSTLIMADSGRSGHGRNHPAEPSGLQKPGLPGFTP